MTDQIPRDIKKSNFIQQDSTGLSDTDTFDFVASGQNFKILLSEMVKRFGAIGTLEQLGEVTGTPVLKQSGTLNQIRNIMGGSGIVSSLSPLDGIKLDHNFTVDTTGLPIMLNKTAVSPTFASLEQGNGISLTADGEHIQIALSATPVSTKTVVVSTMSDFPAAVGGVRDLLADTEYQVITDLSTSDRFTMGDKTIFSGTDGTLITFTYTGSNTLFTSSGNSNKVKDIDLDAPTGSLFNITGDGTIGTVFQCISCGFDSCNIIGTFTDVGVTNFQNYLFRDVITDGITFAGNNTIISFNNGITVQNAGDFIDLGSSTFTGMSIFLTYGILASGTTYLKGAADSANVNAGGLGTVVNIRTLGLGSPLSTITTDDDLWQFDLNASISDTREEGLLSMAGNAVETGITTATVPELILGTWIVGDTSKFDGTTAGRLTYTGPKDMMFPVDATFTGSPVSGVNIPITYCLYKNGVFVTGASQGNIITATSPKNTGLIWQLTMSTGDYLEMYVSNDSTTSNVLITQAKFRIN